MSSVTAFTIIGLFVALVVAVNILYGGFRSRKVDKRLDNYMGEGWEEDDYYSSESRKRFLEGFQDNDALKQLEWMKNKGTSSEIRKVLSSVSDPDVLEKMKEILRR